MGEPAEQIEAPAWPNSGPFIQNRHLSKIVGAPMGWSLQHPLQVGFGRGKLTATGEGKLLAEDRLRAGMAFWDTYAASQPPSGKDSTDLGRVSGSIGGSDAPQHRIDAQRALQRLREKMGFYSYQVIERICGEGYGASNTMQILFGGNYQDAVWSRLREALDELIRAA